WHLKEMICYDKMRLGYGPLPLSRKSSGTRSPQEGGPVTGANHHSHNGWCHWRSSRSTWATRFATDVPLLQ
ncbi:MAG: hypothetical protein NTU41_02360, partial [Chloroflexi bacterium]|nr:hypothetical protein [Chloroflexota bacterium]